MSIKSNSAGAQQAQQPLPPRQQQQQQQQQQPLTPSASTAGLLTHLNHRHLAVLWLVLARVVKEQEWRHSQGRQPPPPRPNPQHDQTTTPSQQQSRPPVSAPLSRGELVELRRLMAQLERAALRMMGGEAAAEVLGGAGPPPNTLPAHSPVQGGDSAAAGGTRGGGSSQRCVWNMRDMANVVSAMGRLGYMPSVRCVLTGPFRYSFE